jgi:hypothetical protein
MVTINIPPKNLQPQSQHQQPQHHQQQYQQQQKLFSLMTTMVEFFFYKNKQIKKYNS